MHRRKLRQFTENERGKRVALSQIIGTEQSCIAEESSKQYGERVKEGEAQRDSNIRGNMDMDNVTLRSRSQYSRRRLPVVSIVSSNVGSKSESRHTTPPLKVFEKEAFPASTAPSSAHTSRLSRSTSQANHFKSGELEPISEEKIGQRTVKFEPEYRNSALDHVAFDDNFTYKKDPFDNKVLGTDKFPVENKRLSLREKIRSLTKTGRPRPSLLSSVTEESASSPLHLVASDKTKTNSNTNITSRRSSKSGVANNSSAVSLPSITGPKVPRK